MDLSKEIKTKRGAIISIHFGKIVTTNLWDKGWYEITNEDVIKFLYLIKKYNKLGKIEEVKGLINTLFTDYPNPDMIGKPYRRSKVKDYTERYETPKVEEGGAPVEEIDINFKKQTAKNLIKFFSEFTFVPAIRFVNTLANCKNYSIAKNYITNYMSLCDHPDRDSICEKIKSDEFKNICNDLFKCSSGNKVNNRLEIYYGPAGTGKTTIAINRYPEAAVTICNENMDSTDLMKTFDFSDENGNPVFKPSQLQLDMINGKPHILDEINLLPLSSLRYLQGILDGKKEIEFEGKMIKIADGFKIIGTMNLIVNGQVFNLPEPIVDRAKIIESYEVNETILANCAF